MQSPTTSTGFSENAQSNMDLIDNDVVQDLNPLDFTKGADVDYFRAQMTEILLKLNLTPANIDRMLSTESLSYDMASRIYTHQYYETGMESITRHLEAHGDKFLGAAMLEYMRRMYTKNGLFVVPPGKITTAVKHIYG